MNEATNFVQTSESFVTISDGTTMTGATYWGSPLSIDTALSRLDILSRALKNAYEAHLISGEHASAIFKKYLKEWELDVKKKGGE